MRRTQLNLDDRTYYHLVSYAEEKKTSLSSAARELINKQIQYEQIGKKNVNPFLELAKAGKKYKSTGPEDLSTNHDYYLYGEGNPKLGKLKK